MEKMTPNFDAPIPGMALTHELGARPWQTPSQYSTVDEAISHYVERMSSEDFNDNLLHVMGLNVPLTTLANTIQMAGVMEGKHNIDVGILVMPVLIEMMMLIGDSNNVEYDSGLENETLGKSNSAVVARAMKELKENMADDTEEETEDVIQEEEIVEKEKGLMSRRIEQ